MPPKAPKRAPHENFKDATGHPEGVPKQEKAHERPPNDNELKDRQNAGKENANAVDKEVKDKNSKRYAALAGLGITGALAAGITAAALADYIASDGAKINLNDISPQSQTASWVPSFIGNVFKPTKLEVSWSVKTVPPGGLSQNVKVLKGNEVYIEGTGITSIDGKSHTVLDVPSEHVFVINSKMSDASQVSSKQGTGTISTTFDENFNQRVEDTAAAAGNAVTSAGSGFLSGIMKVLPSILIMIVLFVVLFFGFQFINNMFQSRRAQGSP